MQDITGCRIVVADIEAQDQAIGVARREFTDAVLIDRRLKPSHGYRAVHLVVRVFGKPIEIQVRTRLQHLWAEFSEKWADADDPAIKYGGGDAEIRGTLLISSHLVQAQETTEAKLLILRSKKESADEAQDLIKEVLHNRQKILELFHGMIATLEE